MVAAFRAISIHIKSFFEVRFATGSHLMRWVGMNKHSAKADLNEAAPLTGTALGNWMRTLVDYVRSGEPDLTNRQMALMMIVYIMPGPHTVRGLADKLNVSKPVITRALNKLGALGYLRRERDEADRRNIFITRTSKGAHFLDGFERFIAESSDEHWGKKRVAS
ncbi:DNA-binding MarR family transcriptional regulator [Rhizorhapis suberifaciens]|uniref:DNA-binding MarR family transcriptional regulator n=2 Tax=Rhizorhapis suberifaciens TaxID=13656 RepID=A0A840HUJ7_9SPHN|nr:DNA-binding MarR family transcriptional regulator [Rhizorhapis suberifaciens]